MSYLLYKVLIQLKSHQYTKYTLANFFLWNALKFNLLHIYEVLQSECTCLNESWEENLLSFLDSSLTSLKSVTFKSLNGNFQNLIPTMIVSNNLKKYTNFKSSNRCKITNESDGVVICGTVISETFKLLLNKNFSYLVQEKKITVVNQAIKW